MSVSVTSCHDDEVMDTESITLDGIESTWEIGRDGGSAIVKVYYMSEEWILEVTDDWIGASATSGASGECIIIGIEENDGDTRETTLTFSLKSRSNITKTVKVTQFGYDIESGTMTHDLKKKHALGYGYNIMKGYADDNSFSQYPILNYAEIVDYEKRSGVEVIEENRRHSLDLKIFSSNTLKGLSKDLSFDMTDDEVSIFGCGETTYASNSVYGKKNASDYCGYIQSSQIETTRTIDIGALHTIVSSYDSEYLSPEFGEAVRKAIDSGNYTDLFTKFGTHLVVSADLGGAISLKAVVQRDQKVNAETAMQYISELILETHLIQDRNKEAYLKRNGLKYQIEISANGGDKSLISQIKTKFKSTGKIDKGILQNWYNSYKFQSADQEYNASMVGCRLIPIYDIFRDIRVRNALLDGFAQYTEGISIHPSDQGKPFYVEISRLKAQTFGASNTILLEDNDSKKRCILSYEYVPAVRKDKRILVIYPILDGKVDYYAGYFLGDKSHYPGRVRWLKYNSFYEPDLPSDNISNYDSMFDSEGCLKEVYYSGYDFHYDRSLIADEISKGIAPICTFDSYYPDKNYVKVGIKYWSLRPEIPHIPTSVPSGIRVFATRMYLKSPRVTFMYFNTAFLTYTGKPEDSRISEIKYLKPIWDKELEYFPKTSELTSMLQMVGHRELFFADNGKSNILGLSWWKGIGYLTDKSNKDGEYPLHANDAYIIPTVGNKGELEFVRLSRSGTPVVIDLKRYVSTVLGSAKYAIYLPFYYARD